MSKRSIERMSLQPAVGDPSPSAHPSQSFTPERSSAPSSAMHMLDEGHFAGHTGGPSSISQTNTPSKRPWWHNLWDSFDKPPEERRLLVKVDTTLLTFACLGYFLKSLDQTNVNNAFVSGMREDLDMTGNEFTWCTTAYMVGYVVAQIPSNLLLTRITPRLWIPFLEIAWGICTLATFSVQSYKSLLALRFLVGFFEAGFYPGQQYILGCWYNHSELGKRSVIFHTAGGIGQMFSGFLQAAAHKHLDGVAGLAGWRWLFIVDGIITIPVAILGFVCYPPLPYQAKPNWQFTQAEIDLANARMAKIGRKGKGALTWSKIARILKSWEIYSFTLLYVMWNSSGASHVMSFWLKYSENPKYSVSQINLYPIPIQAIFVVTAWIYAYSSDGPMKERRYPWIIAVSTFNGIVCMSLAATPVYEHIYRRWVLYYLTGCNIGLSGLCFAWATEVCSRDNEQRALVTASMNDFAYVLQAIAPNFVWRQTDFPKALKGEIYASVLSFGVAVWASAIVVIHRNSEDRRASQVRYQAVETTDDSEELEDSEVLALDFPMK